MAKIRDKNPRLNKGPVDLTSLGNLALAVKAKGARDKAKLSKKKQSKKAAAEAQADDVECVFVMSLLSRIHAELGDFNAALPLAREVLANRR